VGADSGLVAPNRFLIREERKSSKEIRMPPQLVGLLAVERACLKFDVFFRSSKMTRHVFVRLRLELSDAQNDDTIFSSRLTFSEI